MRNIERLLDRARDLCDPPSDYELAKRLGIHQQSISRVRHHGGNLDNYAAFRLAKMLGMDPATVVAYIEEDRAPLPRKEFWRSQLPRLLATVGLAATLYFQPSQRAEAARPVKSVGDTLYIMRTLRRWWDSTRRALIRASRGRGPTRRAPRVGVSAVAWPR